MKRLHVLALLWLFIPSVAVADPPTLEATPPGPDRVVVLHQGDPSPYDGHLFDNDTALRWANWLRGYKLRLRLDVDEQKQLCTIQTGALRQQLGVEQQKYLQVTAEYDKKLLQLQWEQLNPPWYKTPTFYLVTGAVGASLVITGALLSTHQF